MSYSLLANDVNYTDPSQLPALLTLFEGDVSRIYNDGKGNPTIGIGMNLTNSDNMALVLYQLAPSLFTNPPAGGTAQMVAQFDNITSDNPLTGSDDAYTNPQNSSTLKLISLLNQQLANDLGVKVDSLSASFSQFSASDATTALQDALKGGTVIPNYSNITGYGQGTLNWLEGGNPYGIDVSSLNIPQQNTGAWEALVSLFFNQKTSNPLLGRNLLTALNAGDLAQVWYEIRYNSNGGSSAGVAIRRYIESQLFGLVQPGDTYTQALQAYETLTANRAKILTYEQRYGTDPDGSSPTVAAAESDLATAISDVQSPAYGIQAPAVPVTLATAYNTEAERVVAQLDIVYGDVLPEIGIENDPNSAAGSFEVKSTDIFVAPTDLEIAEGFATYAQRDVDPTAGDPGPNGAAEAANDHILIGTETGDTLVGGLGSDILVAQGGNELLEAGVGADTLIADSGNDTVQLGSQLATSSDVVDFVFPSSSGSTYTETVIADGSSGLGTLDVNGTPIGTDLTVSGTDKWTDSSGDTYQFIASTAQLAGYSPGQDDSAVGEMLVSLAGGNQIDIEGFDLTEAEYLGSGFLGIHAPLTLSLTAGANAGFDPPAPNFTAGSSQSYTVYVDAPNTTAQTVTMTLSGVPASDFGIGTGSGVVALGSGGTFTVTIAAEQTSAAFTLVNTGDVGKAATMTLSASMTNPGDSSGQAITSETLTQSYVEPSPDPFLNNATSTVAGKPTTPDSQDPGYDPQDPGFTYNQFKGGTSAGQSEQVVLSTGDNYVIGNGENEFITESAQGNNIILGGPSSSSSILLNGASTVAQAIALTGTDTTASGQRGDVVATGAGNDTIVGGNGNSLYLVGAGANVIYTGAGNDSVWGGFYSPDGAGSYHDQFNWTASVSNTEAASYTYGTHTVSYYLLNSLTESAVGDGGVDTVYPSISSGSDTVVAGNGNDYIELPDGSNYVLGGSGHDNISGGIGNNTIFGGSGTDTIEVGGNGDDYVDAGTGSDLVLFGDGNGNDTVIGGTGNDTILYTTSPAGASSGSGSDYVYGGSGDDLIVGGNGSDTLIAGSGSSSIYGGSGMESIVGGSGNDWLQGGTGNDTIDAGGAGNDTLLGDGGSGSTTYIYGGAGSDAIQGGSGQNVLYAGDGGTASAPTYVTADQTDATATTTIYGGLGVDQLKGGPGSAVIYAGDGGTAAAPTVVIAGTGNTTIYGGLGVDNIQGGSGTDVLYAGDGGDGSNVGGHPTTVIAGTGTDTLYGGAGADVLADTTGGADQLFAGSGNDTLFGSGSDTLTAGSGIDIFSASSGNETYDLGSGFADDQIQQSGGSANLEFGSGIADTDLSITAGFTTAGQGLLEIGDEGEIDVAGGLTGAVGSVGFADGSAYSLDQLISASGVGDGLDQTEQLQGTSDELTFSVDSNATLSTDPSATADTISAWGQNDTVGVSEAADEKSTVFVGGSAAIVTGGSGADTLTAGGGSDSITAGSGNQELAAENYYDVLAGGSGQDTLTATGTNDTLVAGSGIDTMVAAAPTATLVGGSGGGDTFIVNNSADIVQASATAANDTIDASVSYVLPVNVDTLVLEGSSNITGTGNADASNLLEANAGNDTLTAGSGSDTLVGGSGNDVLVAGSGKDLLEGGAESTTYAFDPGFGQTEIEPGAGTGVIQFGTGISAADLTLGLTTDSNGNPALLIQDGNSKVTVDGGLSGSIDQFGFASGTPLTLAELFASGATVLPGSIAGASGDAVINTSAAASLSGSGNDTILGTGAADTLTAGTGTESLLASGDKSSVVGGSGTETLAGAGNADTVVAGNGSQQLYAFGSDDMLVGGMGDDTLYGGTGPDTLVAGTGYTAMYGGAAADSIVLTAGSTVTFTPSSTSSTEVIELPTGMTLADFTAVQGTNGDLILESTTGNTTAIINGYYNNIGTNGTLWMIADNTGQTQLLSTWLGSSATQPPSNYAQEIADLQQAFEANLTATLNQIGQQGGTITAPESSIPQGLGDGYQFSGVSTQDVTVQGGSATLGDSQDDQITSTYTQTGTTTYTETTPVYGDETVPGWQEFVPDSSLTQQQIEVMDSEVGTGNAEGVGIEATTNAAGEPGFEVTQLPMTHYMQTGTTTTIETVPIYTRFNQGTESFTMYNVTGDGGDDGITTGPQYPVPQSGPDVGEDLGPFFVGTVDTGNGNVSVNLGMNNVDNIDGHPAYYPGDPLMLGAFIDAGNGSDEITGTGGADVIAAGSGYDDIDAGLGSTVYVPLEGASTEDIYIQGPFYGAPSSPVGTLVLPSGITPQDLQYRLITNVPDDWQYSNPEDSNVWNPDMNSTGEELQISYGNSSVLLPFGFNGAPLYSAPPNADTDGIDRFVFSDGTVLTRDQIIAMLALPNSNPSLPPVIPSFSISDFNPEVTPTNISVPAGSPIQGGTLFSASDSSGSTISWYQVSNAGTDGGHFDLNGVAQTPGQAFMVSLDQLPELTYVPGTSGTSDQIQVSAFDGVVWSPTATSTVNVETSNLFEATGPDQVVTGSTTGPDTLVGGYGGDTLTGASGQDAFEYASGSGAEVVSETAPITASSNNVLTFGTGISPSALTLSEAAGELVLSTGGTGNSISIEGFNPLDPLQSFPIQSFKFADGTSLTPLQLLADSAVAGTSGSVANSDGSVTSYAFTPSDARIYSAQDVNSSGKITGSVILDANQSELVESYTYNTDGSYTEVAVSTPAGGGVATTTTYDYSASGIKTGEQVQGPDGTSAVYTFNAAGQVVSEDSTAADGTVTDTTYNAQGKPLTVDATSTSGATSDTTYTYNADGSYTEVFVSTPAGGNAASATTTTYDYSASGIKTGEQVQGPNGTSAVYTFNAAGQVVSEDSTAADGTVTDTTYNAQGQPLTVDATNKSGATSDTTYTYNADGSYTEVFVSTPAGGNAASATTTTYDYSAPGTLSNENTYTPGSNGSYTDTWSQAGGSHGTYWWNAATSEYSDTWYDSNGSSWTDEYQYATGGSPGASGYSFDETYSDSAGDKGTRDFNATTGTISLTWDSTTTGAISGTTTDSGFIGLQNQNELTNTQPDLTFFNPKVSPGFQAFLAAH